MIGMTLLTAFNLEMSQKIWIGANRKYLLTMYLGGDVGVRAGGLRCDSI